MLLLVIVFGVLCIESFRHTLELVLSNGGVDVAAENATVWSVWLTMGVLVSCPRVSGWITIPSAIIFAGMYGPEFVSRLDELNQLHFLKPYWSHMLNRFSSFTIASLFTFVVHEIVYFGSWLPYVVMDALPYFQRYKIQQNRQNTWGQTAKCLRQILFNHLVIQFPMILFADWGLNQLGFSMELPLPTLATVGWKCAIMFVIEDFYFYWIHRFLHWKRIYKYVHKVHHEFAAPFGITAEYAHPIETMFLGIGTILGPFLFTRHLFTLWIWLIVRLNETVEDHSGYDLPFNPSNYICFWGGAVHHDFHHRTFDGNYASIFTIWDRVFGTDKAFRIAQAEKRRAHKSTWSDLFDKVSERTMVHKKAKAY